jgi:hypothetical protein
LCLSTAISRAVIFEQDGALIKSNADTFGDLARMCGALEYLSEQFVRNKEISEKFREEISIFFKNLFFFLNSIQTILNSQQFF